MTLIALTHCCHLLGIDGKTLRRWLAQAQLPVEAYPNDARCKGLTSDQLLLLSSVHHRRLTDQPQQWPAPAPAAPPAAVAELSAELLGALETLSALPAQLAALQQQLADLTALVQQPATTVAAPRQKAARLGAPTAVKTVARARPATSSRAKRLAPKAPVLPLIEYGMQGNYVVICPTRGLLTLEPETAAWFAWLSTLSSFRFVGQHGRLTAHRESERLLRAAWRAHRSIRGHTYNLHLGATESLTISALEQAAATLDAHLR